MFNQQTENNINLFKKYISLIHEKHNSNANIVLEVLITTYLDNNKSNLNPINKHYDNFCRELLESFAKSNDNNNSIWILNLETFLQKYPDFNMADEFQLLLCAFFHYYTENYQLDFKGFPKIQEIINHSEKLIAKIKLAILQQTVHCYWITTNFLKASQLDRLLVTAEDQKIFIEVAVANKYFSVLEKLAFIGENKQYCINQLLNFINKENDFSSYKTQACEVLGKLSNNPDIKKIILESFEKYIPGHLNSYKGPASFVYQGMYGLTELADFQSDIIDLLIHFKTDIVEIETIIAMDKLLSIVNAENKAKIFTRLRELIKSQDPVQKLYACKSLIKSELIEDKTIVVNVLLTLTTISLPKEQFFIKIESCELLAKLTTEPQHIETIIKQLSLLIENDASWDILASALEIIIKLTPDFTQQNQCFYLLEIEQSKNNHYAHSSLTRLAISGYYPDKVITRLLKFTNENDNYAFEALLEIATANNEKAKITTELFKQIKEQQLVPLSYKTIATLSSGSEIIIGALEQLIIRWATAKYYDPDRDISCNCAFITIFELTSISGYEQAIKNMLQQKSKDPNINIANLAKQILLTIEKENDPCKKLLSDLESSIYHTSTSNEISSSQLSTMIANVEAVINFPTTDKRQSLANNVNWIITTEQKIFQNAYHPDVQCCLLGLIHNLKTTNIQIKARSPMNNYQDNSLPLAKSGEINVSRSDVISSSTTTSSWSPKFEYNSSSSSLNTIKKKDFDDNEDPNSFQLKTFGNKTT